MVYLHVKGSLPYFAKYCTPNVSGSLLQEVTSSLFCSRKESIKNYISSKRIEIVVNFLFIYALFKRGFS